MIIVSGASKGLGKAIVERLTNNGQEVFGIARDVSKISIDCMSCDVSSYEQVKAVAQEIKKRKIVVDAVINAAGVASMNLAVTTPSKVTQNIIQTNLVGTIYCSQLFAPLMLRNKKGIIINFSTIAVALGLKGESIYTASKAGVEGFSRAFAREMADFNVRVNCIAPSLTKSKMSNFLIKNEKTAEAMAKLHPLKRIGEGFDAANLANFLLSKNSSWITGQIIGVDGGRAAIA